VFLSHCILVGPLCRGSNGSEMVFSVRSRKLACCHELRRGGEVRLSFLVANVVVL